MTATAITRRAMTVTAITVGPNGLTVRAAVDQGRTVVEIWRPADNLETVADYLAAGNTVLDDVDLGSFWAAGVASDIRAWQVGTGRTDVRVGAPPRGYTPGPRVPWEDAS